MKHLINYPKYKRNELTTDDIADIKDVFQDLIDEYDIVYDPHENIRTDSGTISYNIEYYYDDGDPNIGIIVKAEIQIYYIFYKADIKCYLERPNLKKDIDNLVIRLKSMGFTVYTKNHVSGEDIEIYKMEPTYQMLVVQQEPLQTFEKFNERDMNLTKDDYDDIKDIFQDIVDDYDLVEDKEADIDEIHSGIKTYNYNYLDEESFEIELWYEASKAHKLNKELLKFIQRLRNMGYYVYKSEIVHDYVTILISTNFWTLQVGSKSSGTSPCI